MKNRLPKSKISGYPVSTGSLEEHCRLIEAGIQAKTGLWVVTLNLEMIYRAHKNRSYQKLLESADIMVADGVPLLWLSKLKRGEPPIAGRSNGTDLTEKLLKSNIDVNIGVVGGKNPVKAIEKHAPSLLNRIYIYDREVRLSNRKATAALAADIIKNKVELLFLNLGVPKQDLLARIIRSEDSSVTIIGVGGSFDILAGLKPRAPQWMQKNGLEWLFRLLLEPKRLAKRYLIHYPQAVYYLMKDIVISNFKLTE